MPSDRVLIAEIADLRRRLTATKERLQREIQGIVETRKALLVAFPPNAPPEYTDTEALAAKVVGLLTEAMRERNFWKLGEQAAQTMLDETRELLAETARERDAAKAIIVAERSPEWADHAIAFDLASKRADQAEKARDTFAAELRKRDEQIAKLEKEKDEAKKAARAFARAADTERAEAREMKRQRDTLREANKLDTALTGPQHEEVDQLHAEMKRLKSWGEEVERQWRHMKFALDSARKQIDRLAQVATDGAQRALREELATLLVTAGGWKQFNDISMDCKAPMDPVDPSDG